MNKRLTKTLKDALVKKATGYMSEESVDELVADQSGDMKIVKRKITTKYVPPDLSAARLLFEMTGDKTFDFASMSDEELYAEKERLTQMLKKDEKNAK